MSLKLIVFALPLLAISPVQADELVKNGLPCVEEICLGDGIAELSKLKWNTAHNPIKLGNKSVATSARQLNASDLQSLKQTFPEPGDAGAFIYDKQFDATGLPALSRVPAACETNELFGTYISTIGIPTRVGISLTSFPAAPGKQAWTVTTIAREYPTATSNQEKSVITSELSKRYYKFGAGTQATADPKPGEGRFIASGGMNRFGFALSLFRGNDEEKRLKQHPACSAK
jgi:hypothetical protein